MPDSKPLLLVVDDNKDIIFNLKILLEKRGYDVITSMSGDKALKTLSTLSNTPDMIISDIMMPNMDGYEFFNAISTHSKWNQIPFLFLTAKSTPEDIRLGKMLGADDYITKPFNEEDLIASVSGKISRKPADESDHRSTGCVVASAGGPARRQDQSVQPDDSAA